MYKSNVIFYFKYNKFIKPSKLTEQTVMILHLLWMYDWVESTGYTGAVPDGKTVAGFGH